MQVIVRDNNVDQALRALKKKMQREGVFREMKLRRAFEKPSEKRARVRPRPSGGTAKCCASARSAKATNPSFPARSHKRFRRLSEALLLCPGEGPDELHTPASQGLDL